MKTAILPCNGLDKAHGALAREVALRLAEESGNELICPVLWNQAPDRYAKSLDALPLLVIDGCATRCASKLATRLERKIGDRILIADDIKRTGVVLGPSLILDETARQLAHRLASDWLARCAEAPTAPADITSAVEFPAPSEFLEVTHDKFVFQIPAQGFVFNENDVWAQVRGSRARIGISDFAQQQLSDINHCQPPPLGTEVAQFGEVGTIESGKATLEIVSPVAGRVVAANPALAGAPETINQDPYGNGWIVEIALRDFDNDRDLLIGGPEYAELVKRKAAESLRGCPRSGDPVLLVSAPKGRQ